MTTGARRGRWAALAVLVALLPSACGPSGRALREQPEADGTAINFSISVPVEERPALQEVLSRFQNRMRSAVDVGLLTRYRALPATRVNLVTSIDSEHLPERLAADVRRGRPTVHLFAQDNLALRPLVDRGLVQDLSEVRVPEETLDAMRPPPFEGRQLFLPFRPNVRLAYLERQQFRDAGVAPPATVEQLVEAARRLKEASGRPRVTLSLAEGSPAAVTVSEWVVSFGGDPLVLNDEGSVRAFETLQQLWREGLLARESLFGRYDTEVRNLRSGTAWLAQNWSFTSAELAKAGVLGRFDVYAGWQGPVRAAHVIGGDVLGIPRGVEGRQREAALALARYLMSREAQEVLARDNTWPSIRDDAYGQAPPEQRPTFAAIREALRDGWYRPGVAYWPAVSQAMNDAVERILVQGQAVRPVLDRLRGDIAGAARRAGAPYPGEPLPPGPG